MSDAARDQVITDERLAALEHWRKDLELRFAEAFPGGDYLGHCRYHALMIERNEELRRLRAAILEKTIAGLVWAVIVGAGIAAWHYIVSLIKGA